MTEAKIPELTPPGKAKKEKVIPPQTLNADGTVAEKPAKVKKEKAPVDPNAPKKDRAPRTDYGYHGEAKLGLVSGKEIKYRGHRLAWFESVKPFEGKTVKEWEESRKAEKDTPRGWLRFFVQDGTVALTGAPVVVASTPSQTPPAAA